MSARALSPRLKFQPPSGFSFLVAALFMFGLALDLTRPLFILGNPLLCVAGILLLKRF